MAKRRKLKIPFLLKKISTIPSDEDMVAARETVKQYPLMASSMRLHTLIENKFMTETGVQVHPAKFLDEVITYIEKDGPKSKEEFMVYIEQKISSIPPPPPKKKKGFFGFLRGQKVPIPE